MDGNIERGFRGELVPRKERLKRREKAKRIRRIIFSLFVCAASVLVIIWTVSAVERFINWNRMQLTTVKYGVLEEWKEKKAVVVRSETALAVPGTRKSIRYLVEDGTRIHKGALLLKIESPEIDRTGENTNYKLYAPRAGTVYKETDGLESVLTPSGIKSLNLNSVYDKVSKGIMEHQDKEGDTVIKIVDNLSPAYLLFPASEINGEEGSSLSFRISGSGEVITGTVLGTHENIMVLKLTLVPKELMADRLCTIEVITRRASGLVVPASSLVEKNNVSGVYVLSGGNIQWTEVEVKGVFDEKAVVTGIKPGQEIVVNPDIL